MDKLIELLLKNPIIAVFLVIWIAGSIGNAVQAKKRAEKRRRRSGPKSEPAQTRVEPVSRPSPVARQAPQPSSAPQPSPAPAAGGGRLSGSAAQTPEQIAREMRRILGLEPDPPRPAPPSRPAPPPPPPPPPGPAREALKDDLARYASRVDPHVGESIRDRHMAATKVGQPRGGRGAIGNLGGRVATQARQARRGSRYALDDLRRAIVINEILSPPVGLRGYEERRPT